MPAFYLLQTLRIVNHPPFTIRKVQSRKSKLSPARLLQAVTTVDSHTYSHFHETTTTIALDNQPAMSNTTATVDLSGANKPRGLNYTPIEDLAIAKSFIEASEDSIKGNAQKGEVFKQTMFEIYTRRMEGQYAVDLQVMKNASESALDQMALSNGGYRVATQKRASKRKQATPKHVIKHNTTINECCMSSMPNLAEVGVFKIGLYYCFSNWSLNPADVKIEDLRQLHLKWEFSSCEDTQQEIGWMFESQRVLYTLMLDLAGLDVAGEYKLKKPICRITICTVPSGQPVLVFGPMKDPTSVHLWQRHKSSWTPRLPKNWVG